MFNLFVLLVCVVLTNANAVNNTEKTIKNLEKEKYELALKIQAAIDDSAKALQKTNDSDAVAGLEHLEELKKHFNESALQGGNDFKNASRRSERARYIQKGKVKLDLFDIASLFGKKETVNKLVREQNQALMREKLRDWIKQKELERKNIKAYKEKMNLISERCPRNGKGDSKSKKKKKKSRRSLDIALSPSEEKRKKEKEEKKEKKMREKAQKREANRKQYPCCRKCCKRSYLGCL